MKRSSCRLRCHEEYERKAVGDRNSVAGASRRSAARRVFLNLKSRPAARYVPNFLGISGGRVRSGILMKTRLLLGAAAVLTLAGGQAFAAGNGYVGAAYIESETDGP